jgi:hypothetical protein
MSAELPLDDIEQRIAALKAPRQVEVVVMPRSAEAPAATKDAPRPTYEHIVIRDAETLLVEKIISRPVDA